MKYFLFPLITFVCICWASPISSYPDLADIWKGNQYIFPFVEDVPSSLLAGGFTDLAIAGVPSGELAMNVYLLGIGKDEPEVIAWGPYQGEYNFAKSFAYWIPDRSVIELTFQMPFCARYAGADYELQGSELVPVEWLSGDPSMDAIENIDSLLALGEIGEAGEELSTMFYPGYYYQPGEMLAKFLRTAHQFALDAYHDGNLQQAGDYYIEIGQLTDILMVRYPWYSAFEDSTHYFDSNLSDFMTIGEFTAIANDYGFFLEQTGNCDMAVDALYGVLSLDPHRMVAYLNLGDALWKLGEYHNAVDYYMVYKDMMEGVNLQDDIPPRVDQRILNSVGPM